MSSLPNRTRCPSPVRPALPSSTRMRHIRKSISDLHCWRAGPGRAGPGRHLGRLAAQSVRFILPITSAQYSLVGRRNTYGREHQSYGGQYFAQAAPTITTLAIFSCRSRQMLPLILPENVSENAGVKITLLPSVKTRNVRYRTRKSIPGREKDNLSFLSNAGSRRSGTCWSSDAGSGQNEHIFRRPFLCCCCTTYRERFARRCP